MENTYIADLASFEGKKVQVNGWVANKRISKGLIFIVLRDGSGFCQCIFDEKTLDETVFNEAKSLTLESSISISGAIVKDNRQVGGYEIHVSDLKVFQLSADFPIAKKEHGVDFLMDHRHLWLRSKKQWAIMRVRNKVKWHINKFFQEEGFLQLDSPLFTGSSAEGTTTLFSTDFYGNPAYLAQTGQLYGEAMALAFGKVYTFGPTFRAEKSKTRRHLSEFWMIEPEMAFYNNEMNMDLIERFIRSVVKNVVNECSTELHMLNRDVSKLNVEKPFPRITYDNAIEILKGNKEVNGKNALVLLEEDLKKAESLALEKQTEINERQALIDGGGIKKGVRNFNQSKIDSLKIELKELKEKINNIPKWIESAKNFKHGNDLGGSDETILTRLFETPIMIYNWPKAIKAFYMKSVENKTDYVKGVDVLAPEGFGEIVGGSERESDINILKKAIKDHNLPIDTFNWYLDLRKYGSVPHAGFGLGLERFICWICNVKHIREVIPFPRMYGRLFP